MKRTLAARTLRLALGIGMLALASRSFADDLTWIGAADGNFSTPSNWAGDVFPDPQFLGDSLKFNTAGVTITNDYDPGVSGTIELGLGTGANTDSGNFHFQAGSGDFTFDGFGVLAGPSNSHSTLVRADAGAGMTQTFDLDIDFNAGVHERRIAMNNSDNTDRTDPATAGKVIFNGNLDFRSDQIFVSESRAYVVLNGNNVGGGRNSITSGTNTASAPVRINGEAADATLGTFIELGTNTALGNASAGTWATGDLNMRGIQAIAPTYITTSAALDLSEYAFQLQSGGGPVGGSVNYRSAFDSTIGWVFNVTGNRDMVVSDAGKLTIAHGIFLSTNTTAGQLNIKTPGTSGSNGELIINGPLHNTYVDPTTTATNGLTASGGISTTRGAQDGTQVNATLRVNNGIYRLNVDSSTTWIGSEFRAIGNSTTIVGNDNAFGDSTSIIDIDPGSTIDLNGHSIAQRFEQLDGAGVGGAGSLINSDTGSTSVLSADLVNPGNFAIGGAGDITFQGRIQRNVPGFTVTKVGTGTLRTEGSDHNNLMAWQVNEGTVIFANSTGYGADRAVTIDGGTVRLDGANTNLINNAELMTINSGTFDLNGKSEVISLQGAGGNVTNSAASTTSTLTVGDTGGDYAGTIEDGAGAVAFRKTGGGQTQVLSGNNTYSGTTTVSFGTLEVNGSISGTSQVVVDNGAVLAGTGTVKSPDWDIHGTVQPGSVSPTVSDVLTLDLSASTGTPMLFQSDSTVSFVLGAGVSNSQIDVLGSASSLLAFDNNTFDFTDLTGGSLATGTYTLFDGDVNTAYSLGASVTLSGLGAYPGSTLAVSGNDLVLNLSGGGGLAGDFDHDNDVDGADFLVWQRNPGVGNLPDWQGNYGAPIVAAVAAVPEPATMLLLCTGVVLFGTRRR